jgi:hypothetical protein
MTISKAQACGLLHISESTLQRRMRSGRYQFTKAGDGQYAEVRFTYEGLGLVKPTPEPTPALMEQLSTRPAEPTPELQNTFAPREPTREERDAEFARAYLAGEATDSCGNTINVKTCSLLGPVDFEPLEISRKHTQQHMKPELTNQDADGNIINTTPHSFDIGEGTTRGGSPLAAGLSQETYDAMMTAWQRSGGGPSMSEQEMKIRQDKANIERAFPKSPRANRSTVR